MIDLNEVQQSPNRLNCCKCIQLNNIQYTSIQDFQVQWINYQKKKQKCYRHFEENIQTRTKKLENIIFDIQAQITKQIIKIKNEINEAFAHLQTVLLKTQEEIQYENLLFKNYEQILEMADDISNQKSFKQIESNLNIYQINWNLLTSSSQQKLEEILNNSQVILTNNKNEKYSIMQNENNQITSLKIDGFIQPINYQLLQEYSIKQVESCNAIAFNKDCSIVVAAQDKDINIFEFSQGLMKKIQTLSEHRNKIYTLTFMKKSNEFISGSCDVQIRVWTNKQNHLWICQQILDGHCGYITCLILNNNENLIISGSEDKKIKFWIKQIKWECQQTITDHSKDVYGLSLNNQQNQLISCSYDNTILVIGKSWWNKKWSVIQKINVEKYGHRLCFINDNLFTFQPYAQDCMHIYEFNNQNKQFIKKKTFQVKCGTDYNSQLFPQQFIKSKNLLINKIGQFINLIKFKEDEEFLIEQSIDFETNCLFGSISDNGDYLITWDKKSEEIQIRKYTEQ
ncbi:unnamed protein product [Paramecium sonneborni]|uniref:WD40-repeat-containing domain n=1 Tax=Paramecium sonneborni TaxID=65129 RepID=A0A8S1MGM6_9CILI|nr:unnamed protein product [Paramecium sonneborni]